jgi:hypothetical protein
LAQSLKTYLSNRTDVQGARRNFFDVGADLATIKRQWESTPQTAANYQDILNAYKDAQAKYKDAERAKNLAESNARVDYDAMTSKKEVKNQQTKDAQTKKEIDAVQSQIDKYTEAGETPPASLIEEKKALEGQYTGAPKGTATTTTTTTTATTGATGVAGTNNVDLDTFLRNLNEAGVAKINEVRGYLGLPLNGEVDFDLIAKTEDVEKRLQQEESIKGPIDRLEYYLKYKKTGGAGGGAGTTTVSISSPTEAAAYINSAFRSLLGRYATTEEIKELAPKLNAAEKKNPSRTVNGVSTGGLNRDQFLLDIVTKRPEYIEKKKSAQSLTKQELATVARSNGLDIDKNFTNQVDSWIKRVENGEDIDIFKNLIRQTAKVGLPDKVGKLLDEGVDLETVYSPYRNAMASTLEINPETINLNDSTLRSAIGPDKEMPIYEFERNLRKDSRWQYTNNAREEAYAAVNKILQDFGFRS